MRRITAVFAVAGIFLAGVLAGGVIAGLITIHHLRTPGWLFSYGSRMRAAELRRELDLTPEQAKQVDAILTQTHSEVMALRHKLTPELKAVIERSRQRIEAVLNPEQRTKFQALRRKHRERSRRWTGSGSPHAEPSAPPPPPLRSGD